MKKAKKENVISNLEKLIGKENLEKAKECWSSGKAFLFKGMEVVDPRPMEKPVGFEKPESIQDKVKRMVKVELSQQAEKQGFESFAESLDFDTGEDDRDEYATDPERYEELSKKAATMTDEEPVKKSPVEEPEKAAPEKAA